METIPEGIPYSINRRDESFIVGRSLLKLIKEQDSKVFKNNFDNHSLFTNNYDINVNNKHTILFSIRSKELEMEGIDPTASRMLSERSTD